MSDHASAPRGAPAGALPPMLVADAPALDLLNTVATPADAPVEWLSDGRALLAWLEAAGLAPAEALAVAAKARPEALDAAAEAARGLREWFRGFVLKHAGRPLGAAALGELAPLNGMLAKDAAHGEIVAGASAAHHAASLDLRWTRDWRDPAALLQPVAHAMADLVTHADFSRVRRCEGHGCTLVFLDLSKRNARRWCSMAVCGNRAKQAALRARRRAG